MVAKVAVVATRAVAKVAAVVTAVAVAKVKAKAVVTRAAAKVVAPRVAIKAAHAVRPHRRTGLRIWMTIFLFKENVV